MSEEFYDAALNQDTVTMERMLRSDKEFDINWQSDGGITAFSLLVEADSVESCRLLIYHGADIDIRDEDGFSPLYYATHNRNAEMCELLVTNNVNVTVELVCAADFGAYDVCKVLIPYANIEYEDDEMTALMCAAKKNYPKVCELLLENGAQVCEALDQVYSEKVLTILKNWKSYLPDWKVVETRKVYPQKFKDIAFEWLLVAKRVGFYKDMRNLILEYIARVWKSE